MKLRSFDTIWKTRNLRRNSMFRKTQIILWNMRRICLKNPLALFTLQMMFRVAISWFCVNLRDIGATLHLKWHNLESSMEFSQKSEKLIPNISTARTLALSKILCIHLYSLLNKYWATVYSTFMSVVDHGKFSQPSLYSLISSSWKKFNGRGIYWNTRTNSLAVMKSSWIHFEMDRPERKTCKRKNVEDPCTDCGLQARPKIHGVMCNWCGQWCCCSHTKYTSHT